MHVKLSGPSDLMEFPIDDLRVRLLNPGPEVGTNIYKTILTPALPEGIDAEYKKDITLHLDTFLERILPVTPVLEPSPGVSIGFVKVQPPTIKVEGPASRINAMSGVTTRPLRLSPGDGIVVNRVLLGELPLRTALAANQSIEVEVQARVLPGNWKEKKGYTTIENLEVHCGPATPGIAIKEAPPVSIYLKEDSKLKERDLNPAILCPVFTKGDLSEILPRLAAADFLVGIDAPGDALDQVLAIEPYFLEATFKKEAIRKAKPGVIREVFSDHVIRPE
jgi:hypothetical protein